MKAVLGSLAAACLVAACGVASATAAADRAPCPTRTAHPWCNRHLAPNRRAALLLAALTQDEKLSLLAGVTSSHTGQTAAVPRVGLRPAYLTDNGVIVEPGPSTAPPIPIALAATFDTRLAHLHGRVIGDEARLGGNDIVLGPTVNIMRTPLGGRTFEAFGEDPFLVSRMAVGWIEGAQSQGVIAEVKHFCCNNQEGKYFAIGEKEYSSSDLDERTLREIYLPQFEAAIKEAHAGSVMCAYNRVNGDWACAQHHLLSDILKGEWRFPGVVVSDWEAHHPTAEALKAGLDVEMPTASDYSPALVQAAVTSGLATQAQVDDHVRRLLRTLFAFGFFDRRPYADDPRLIDVRGHARAAERIEESGLTLLQNRGLLPLRARRLHSIALIGPQADRFENGGGAVGTRPFVYTTPRQAITRRAGRHVRVRYDDGSDPVRAASVAHGADVAIVFASDSEGEYMDKRCPTVDCSLQALNSDQDGLIAKVAAANRRTIVVLETGDPVLTPWRGNVRAILEAWYPGEEGGTALARVLFGDADPGGRLPVTFPASADAYPTAGDPTAYPGGTDVFYREGVLVGYRWYDAHHVTPAFPFGFGLSYTRFAYDRLRITAPGRGPALARVSLRVRNTGRRRGSDVPQLYLGLPEPSPTIVQPPRQLKGFRKVALAPGRSTRVTFAINARDLSWWDTAAGGWRVAPGCYGVMVGRSSRRIALHATVAVAGAACPGAAARIALR